MKKRNTRARTPAPQAPVAEMRNEESNPPDMPIATFVTNHNAVAQVVMTGPKDRRINVVHFTFPNGDRHAATIGAVLVLRELCDQIIRNCGTVCLVAQSEPAPGKEGP
jgi:hypothetical protein